jgi:raffinose/stachyose/melibiose transport system substrate-binding protein
MEMLNRRRARALAGMMAAGTMALAACSGDGGDASSSEEVTLTWFQGSGVEANLKTSEALVKAFEAENPDINIEIDASGPSDNAIDNVIKTRLASDSMADMFWYNSGSLLQGLNPDQTLLNIADEDFTGRLDEGWIDAVSTDDGVYGVPVSTAGAAGILYNIPLYDELGLAVPKTWDEFMANNEKIKAAGHTAVQQTYGDSWTAQIMLLADFYNVYVNDEDWGDKWTANEVGFVDDPMARRGFEKLDELQEGGFFNKDYASSLLNDGLAAVATGEAAHYPSLAGVVSTIAANNPDQLDDVGFFPIPGDSAENVGVTGWYPAAVYAPATTPHPNEVKKFMNFVASPAGCDAITEAVGVTGAYLVEGCTLPDSAPRVIADMLPYYEAGDVAPALEYLSPVKGPNLPQIAVEVGSGIRDAESAAKAYQQDAAAQAQQLGLKGW